MGPKGWIALDIDGTITDNIYSIPSEVHLFLKGLHLQGWNIMFLTGRSFAFAIGSLKIFDFPYHLATQNGADILEMPTKKTLHRFHMEKDVIAPIEEIYRSKKEDFLIYSGFESGDFCYFRPNRFSSKYSKFLNELQTLSSPWKVIDSFDAIEQKSFPLIKCVGTKVEMQEVQASLQQIKGIQQTLINDRVCPELTLILITHEKATKGDALQAILNQSKCKGPVIAAGDDCNDISMLQVADIRIVIESAPKEVLKHAHIIAPHAKDLGIISALTKATKGAV